ncbi:MAG TPA: 2-C-methyl-D-erythritol 2,4-cyclodiphosphate synthase [Acidimicrobiales bacterium]|nr:2-C-methyl-D-erythritol 2,4-cyclodiphosphate synthase [Acidimicrobiales bacterium]
MSADGHGMGSMRIGQGFDVHRFSDDPARQLVLGGVSIEGEPGLEGHSDADVVCHALADALLGAAALGDLGLHFPDTDPAWSGARSLELLERVRSMLGKEQLEVLNADCTVVCERPRLAGYTRQMSERLAAVLGAPVGVKATRAEGLGALGRAEGIACIAVALVTGPGR